MMAWTAIPLSELCEIKIGRTPSRNRMEYWGVGYPWLSIADMNQGRALHRTKEQISLFAAKNVMGAPVPAGTVLLSFKLSIGKVGISEIPLYTNEAIAALPIRDTKRLDIRFLYWALRTIDLTRETDRAAMGQTLNKKKLANIAIPVPPLDEQRRIVQVLDSVDALRAKRHKAIALLDDLAHSIFIDMFGHPIDNPMGFPVSTVYEIAEKVTDGEHFTPKRELSGIKLLSARNVRDGSLDLSNVDFIGVEEFQRIRKRCDPRRGDVLISCSGTIGRVTPVETTEPFALVRSVALVRPRVDVITTDYLSSYLRTQALKERMLQRAKASSQANLFQGPIRELPVLLPPFELQLNFGQRVNKVSTVKATHRAHLAELNALFASLQYRAFRGELWAGSPAA